MRPWNFMLKFFKGKKQKDYVVILFWLDYYKNPRQHEGTASNS